MTRFPATGRDLTAGGRLSGGGPLGSRSGARAGGLAALLAALAVLGSCTLLPGDAEADDVDALALAGPRSPGCVRLLVLSDVSGSMAEHTATRTAALDRILDWAPANLAPHDELGVLIYAGSATATLPVTTVEEFGRARLGTSAPAVPDGTRLDGVIETIDELPATVCRTTLLFLTDGVLTEPPVADVDDVLRPAGVASVVTIFPDGARPPDSWRDVFPYGTEVEVPDRDPGRLAVLVAETLAAATGQEVRRVDA